MHPDQHFRTTVDHAPVGIAHMALDGRWLYANQRLCTLYGYSAAELFALRFQELTYPDDLAADLAHYERLLAGEIPSYNLEKRYFRKDGSIVWGNLTVALARDEQGTPAYSIAVVEDITERKRAERELIRNELALRASETLFRTTIAEAPIGISMTDAEGTYILANAALCTMLGYTEAELRTKTFRDVTHPDDVTHDDAHFRDLLQSKRDQYQMDKRYIRKDGTVVWTRLTTTFIRDEEGNLTHNMGMVEDRTKQKVAEERLEYQATHDSLTGLPNRALLHDRLHQGAATYARTGRPFALLLLDLDRFKEVNDTFGHHCGDLLLQHVSERLRAILRDMDTVGRLGGDEFAVLLPDTEEAGALHVGEKVEQVLNRPYLLEGHTIQSRASVGVALCPDHGLDAETLLRRADTAMYVVKRGRLCAAHHDQTTAPLPGYSSAVSLHCQVVKR